MQNWRKSESTVRPVSPNTNSPSTVYIYRNIKETKRKDEMTGEEITIYVYEEQEMTPAEYSMYLQNAELKTNQESMLEAITGLYELIGMQ